MKRLEKQLPSKANCRSFLLINFYNFKLKWCNFRVTKNSKEVMSEEAWGELESNSRQ